MTGSGRYFAGVACVVGYIMIASAQSVALNVWLASADVYLVAGLSFVVVTCCFAAVGGRAGAGPYRLVLGRRRELLALNVTSVFNWLFYFLAVKYLEPAVAVTLTQGIGPLSMTAYDLARGRRISRVTLGCHGAILLAAAAMCWAVIRGGTAAGPHGRGETVLGIAIAVACSLSITATVVLSKAFARARVPASVVLSVRFPLLVLTCLAILPTQSGVHLDAGTAGIILAVGLVGITTAVYFLQRGVELAPPLAVSTCLALSPVVVFAIDTVRHAAAPDLTIFGLIAGIVVVSLVSIVYDGVSAPAAGERRSPEPETAARP